MNPCFFLAGLMLYLFPQILCCFAAYLTWRMVGWILRS